MKKNKIILMFLAVLIFCLAGCSSKNESSTNGVVFGKGAFETGAKYTYMYDKWNLYVATALSDESIKIEHWYRFTANNENPFELDHDVCIVSVKDNGFRWIGDNKSCFEVSINDEDELNSNEPVSFTKYDDKIEEIHLKQIANGSDYGFQHDKWNLYIAKKLSDSVVKIEHWYRFTANDETPFEYQMDICVIDVNSNDVDFKWLDNGQTCFQVTMRDEDNSYWEEVETVSFSLDVEKYIITPPNSTEN